MRIIVAVVVVAGLMGCTEEKATLEEAKEQVTCPDDATKTCAIACVERVPLGRECTPTEPIAEPWGEHVRTMWGGVCWKISSTSYGGLSGCCAGGQFYGCK